jgi:hypothetical protein
MAKRLGVIVVTVLLVMAVRVVPRPAVRVLGDTTRPVIMLPQAEASSGLDPWGAPTALARGGK